MRKYRVLKSKGLYYIQEQEVNYNYPTLIILTPLWYLYNYLFNKKLLDPFYTWVISDRCKTYESLDDSFDRIKILREPDKVFEVLPDNMVYEGMKKPVQVRYTY